MDKLQKILDRIMVILAIVLILTISYRLYTAESAIKTLQFQTQNLNVNVWNTYEGVTYSAKPEN